MTNPGNYPATPPTPQGLLEVSHELMERLEAHLTAEQFYSVGVAVLAKVYSGLLRLTHAY